MVTDYMSKALQGQLFAKFRNMIMGWEYTMMSLFSINSIEEHIAENGNSRVELPKPKITYVDALQASKAVEAKNVYIAQHGDPMKLK